MGISTALSLALRRRGGASDGSSVGVAVGNELDELITAKGLPDYTDLTRKGMGWNVMTATAFAGIVGVPSTTAQLEVKNGNASRSLVVESIWAYQLLGTAVVWAIVPWAQVGAAVVSAVTGLVVNSQNGKASYTSAAGTDLVTAINQTVVARGWRPFPGSTSPFGLAAATPGGVVVGQVDGRLIVPPGMALHVAVSSSVNTASALHCGAAGYFASITNE